MTRPASCRSRGVWHAVHVVLAVAVLSAFPGGAWARPRGPLADSMAVLAGASLHQATVGTLVLSEEGGDTLLAWRERDRLVPGSNTKLFTTGAFLKRFGPDARWATLVLARGSASVKDRGARVRFQGDLVLRGSGIPDVVPLLSPGSRGLVDSIAVLLRAGGLEKFEGTLWIDGSLFSAEPYPDGWAHEDLVYSFSAPVNAVLANGNAVRIVATGGDGKVTVALDPPGAPLTLRGAPALGAPGSAPRLTVRRELGSRVIDVGGSVPPGGVAGQSVAVPDPDSTAGLFLLEAMKRAGIETKATVRVFPARVDDAGKRRKDLEPFAAVPFGDAAPSSAVPWSQVRKDRAAVALTLPSPPAAEVVGIVNAFSLNTESEALLRLLDPAPRGKQSERGLAEVYRIVAEGGIDTMDLFLSDGSGLSRMNLATASAIAGWLLVMARDPVLGPRFREGLSSPGGHGTLEHRFPGLAEGAAVHGKTGTLTNVSSLSGYLTTSGGERIVFSMMCNGTRGSVAPARRVQDALVGLLSRRAKGPARTASPVFGIPR